MMDTNIYQHIALWIEKSDHVVELQRMESVDAQRSSHALTTYKTLRDFPLPTTLFYLSPSHLSTLLSGKVKLHMDTQTHKPGSSLGTFKYNQDLYLVSPHKIAT